MQVLKVYSSLILVTPTFALLEKNIFIFDHFNFFRFIFYEFDEVLIILNCLFYTYCINVNFKKLILLIFLDINAQYPICGHLKFPSPRPIIAILNLLFPTKPTFETRSASEACTEHIGFGEPREFKHNGIFI